MNSEHKTMTEKKLLVLTSMYDCLRRNTLLIESVFLILVHAIRRNQHHLLVLNLRKPRVGGMVPKKEREPGLR